MTLGGRGEGAENSQPVRKRTGLLVGNFGKNSRRGTKILF